MVFHEKPIHAATSREINHRKLQEVDAPAVSKQTSEIASVAIR